MPPRLRARRARSRIWAWSPSFPRSVPVVCIMRTDGTDVKERRLKRMRTTTSKRVEQGDATRLQLVAAARRLFGEHGYAATTLQGIVAAAEVTKGAFYHHFASKREIFLAVYEQVQREIGREAFVVHLDHETASDAARPAVRNLAGESHEQVWNHLLAGCRAYLQLHTRPD